MSTLTATIKKLTSGIALTGLLIGAPAAFASSNGTDPVKLDAVLAAQDDAAKNRYEWRHPKETITFFGIEPGMTVIEALPGGGWYSKILGGYLGKDGTLVAANYNDDVWEKFGFLSPEFIKERIAATPNWSKDVAGWVPSDTPKTKAYTFENFPKSMNNQADAALFVRALHNLYRFNGEYGYFDQALSATYKALKPGGVLGVVQHQTDSTTGVDGARGYMNKKQLISAIEKAGFKFVGESPVNQNAKDKPTAEDIVWRLAPSFATTKEGEPKRAEYAAIGESNRMTLKFIKPAK